MSLSESTDDEQWTNRPFEVERSERMREDEKRSEDDGWREYEWSKHYESGWKCNLLEGFCFEFQGEKGEELQLSDRRYRDGELASEKTRLLRSVLRDATGLQVSHENLKNIDMFAAILQGSDDAAPVLESLELRDFAIERLRPFLDVVAARKLLELKSLRLKKISENLSYPGRSLLAPDGSMPCEQYFANVIGSDNLPNLTKLVFSDSVFWYKSNRFKSLVASLKNIGGGLRELNLNWVPIETEGHLALAEIMESGHLQHLEKLDLQNTWLSSAASVAYGKGLPHLKALKRLDFSWNPDLEQAGHVALAEAMESGHLLALESLDLVGTRMNDAGCKAYTKAFLSGSVFALKRINFNHNDIGDEGAKALSEAFASGQMRKMVSIDIGKNNIGDVGMEAICKAIMKGHLRDLTELDLYYNSWSNLSFLASAIRSGGLNSLRSFCLAEWGNVPGKVFQPILAAVSETKCFTAIVKGLPADQASQMQALRDRNLKHVQMMKELGGPVVPATHAKIYLCGNQEAGKTTLRKTLLRSLRKSLCMWERGPHREERTRGIAMSELKSEGKDGVSLALWDMAGQGEYHMVHHAFLRDLASLDAKSTFFIIVCKSQEDMTKVGDELEYWLHFLASSCRKDIQAPRGVFVVLNRNRGDSGILEQSKMNAWKVHLTNMKQKFNGYLNICPEEPNTEVQNVFVMDIRRRKSVLSLKKSVIQLSKQMLQDTDVPEICYRIQVEVNVWKTKMPFPVLHWREFLKKVQEIDRQWKEKTVEAAARYLNGAGLVVYINREFPADWQLPDTQLVILDPNWMCTEVVGNIFLPEDLKKPRFRELNVKPSNGAVSVGELKDSFKTKNFAWKDSDLQDVMIMLLWLGLCYKDGAGNLFIPSRIKEDPSRGKCWDGLSISLNTVDQWVMGFSVEYRESEIGLAPIGLWHNFQVELAQTSEYNGDGLGNNFTVGKHFVGFKCKQMVVLIEVNVVNVGNDNPTFRSIHFFVKPIDGKAKTTKEDQVDLAHKLVQILCKLWGEVCPGICHVSKVVWPWPASLPKPDFTDLELKDLCWEVSNVKRKVQENGMGMPALARVGQSGEITYEQLLCGLDIADVVTSLKGDLQNKVQAWNGEMEEGIRLGVFPDDMLKRKGFTFGTKDEASTSRGFIVRENFTPTEADQLKSMTRTELEIFRYLEYQRRLAEQILAVAQQTQDIAFDNQRMIREVYKELNQVKMQQELTLEKLQNFEQLFLENAEQSCPRFIYLVTKSSGSSVVTTLKNAKSRISPTVKFHVRFLCEAPYDASGKRGQHAVADDLQEGIDVSTLKDWARKLAPWLKVSFTVLSISAKFATNILAPGLGSIVPDLGSIVPSTLAALIVAGTGYSLSSLDMLMHEHQVPNSVSSPKNPQELSGSSRKEMTDILSKLSVSEFEKKVGLSKVCLKQVKGSSFESSVLWICSKCKRVYSESNQISRTFEL